MEIEVATCDGCGAELEAVRPGHHQCNYCDGYGWTLVPVRVTAEMESVYANDTGAYQTAQELHDAMIRAAHNTN